MFALGVTESSWAGDGIAADAETQWRFVGLWGREGHVCCSPRQKAQFEEQMGI